MPKSQNQEKFRRLRNDYPFMAFDGFEYQYSDKGLRAQFHFSLADKILFHPTLIVPYKEFFIPENITDPFLENILFHIGMVESISYWKTACPPKLIIRNHTMSEDQIEWWKKLYFNGLGEFRYLNSLDVSIDEFLNIESSKHFDLPHFNLQLENSCLIPIGGGKDSVVTLELLGRKSGNIPLILNPREASKGTVMKIGLYYDSIAEVQRTIDPALLELNARGFLNGHTPFSALLGFIAVLMAGISGRKFIVLSNESSANESTVKDSEVNHQYSKSIEFEKDLREYLQKFVYSEIDYFSLLRPLNELQIARLFSGFPKYFDVFRSCNVGSKTDSWCGQCAKCLFTYVILSPFMSEETLEGVFGRNLLNDNELWPLLQELIGQTPVKPFDCIGTTEEVNAALLMTLEKTAEDRMPVLLRHYRDSMADVTSNKIDASSLLGAFNENNFVPEEFSALLRSKINE